MDLDDADAESDAEGGRGREVGGDAGAQAGASGGASKADKRQHVMADIYRMRCLPNQKQCVLQVLRRLPPPEAHPPPLRPPSRKRASAPPALLVFGWNLRSGSCRSICHACSKVLPAVAWSVRMPR